MFIDIKEIKQKKIAAKEFEFFINKPQVNIGKEIISFKNPIKVELLVTLTSEGINLDGVLFAEGEFQCHRCLDFFAAKIEVLINEDLIVVNNFYCFTDNHENRICAAGDSKINLEPIIEQAIYMAVPMKIICKENCLGLCPKCGSNLNKNKCKCEKDILDPRLADLQHFFEK